MAYATAPITARFDLAARLRGAAADVAEAWTNYRAYRDTYAQLKELSAHELDDLGIAPGQLKAIAHESVYGA